MSSGSSTREAARYGYRDPAARPVPGPSEARLSEEARLTLYGEEADPSAMPMSQEEAEREGGSRRRVAGKAVPVGGCHIPAGYVGNASATFKNTISSARPPM
ncbi:hypothetical protein [Streptomyces sp. NPDC058739]|uniref:hypothetical protein n=1 Tax=Streptomyces sp. NPDC058739 TaxID=3346618 RepID=UPI0036B0173E